MNARQRGEVIADSLQDRGYKTKGTVSDTDDYWLHVYKSGRKVMLLIVHKDSVDVVEEVEPGTARALLKPIGVDAPVTKKKVPWAGTYDIDSRLRVIQNRLVSVILSEEPREMPRPWPLGTMALGSPVKPDEAIKDIKDAVEAHEWLASQSPPMRERSWVDRNLEGLARQIDRAQAALPKIIKAGRYAAEQKAEAEQQKGRHPYGVRFGNLWYDTRADTPDEAIKKIKDSFARRGIAPPPGAVSVSEFAERSGRSSPQ